MTDNEFLDLTPEQASRALHRVAKLEVPRLQRLYWRRYFIRLDPSPGEQLTAPDATPNPATSATATRAQSPSVQPRLPTESVMRFLGIFLLLGGLICSVIAWLLAFGAVDLDARIQSASVAWLFSSIAGLGAFMWMLGILEQRLIEIRVVLSQSVQTTAD